MNQNYEYQTFHNDNSNIPGSVHNAKYYRSRAKKVLSGYVWLFVLLSIFVYLLNGSGIVNYYSFSIVKSFTMNEITSEDFTQNIENYITNREFLELMDYLCVDNWNILIIYNIFGILFSISVYIFIGGPIWNAFLRQFLDLFDKNRVHHRKLFDILFQYMKSSQMYWKSVKCRAIQFCIHLVTFLMVMATTITSLMFNNENIYIILCVQFLMLTLAILAVIADIFLTCGFSQVNFLLIENENVSIKSIFKKSWKIMKGNKWKYFCLQFSFIGWLLLASIFTIKLIFVLPMGIIILDVYKTAANTVYYDDVSKRTRWYDNDTYYADYTVNF